MNKCAAFLSLLLFCQGLEAAQYVCMDHTNVISVKLSSRSHNRISISGDRIKKAFYKGSYVSVEVEEETGQLFVQAMRPNCPDTTLSIVSTSGVVQDLELCFQEAPSEIVILKPNNTFDEQVMEVVEPVCSVVEQNSLTILIDGIIKGVIPEEYTSIEDQEKPQKTREGLQMQRLQRLVSHDQIVFIYRLQNISCKTRQVMECQVNILDGDWVFLDRNNLRPDECAIVLIGCMR